MLELWAWRQRVAEIYRQVCTAADAQAAWQEWRRTRDDLMACHPQSALDARQRAHFAGLDYFEYDPTARLNVGLIPVDAEPLYQSGGDDGRIQLTACARTVGLVDRFGAELEVFWIGGYGGGLFLPFKDASNGAGSYGGGRYLFDTIKGADLVIVRRADDTNPITWRGWMDFNFAYNPSCANSPAWVCPLAPPGNRLPVAVAAGERFNPALLALAISPGGE